MKRINTKATDIEKASLFFSVKSYRTFFKPVQGGLVAGTYVLVMLLLVLTSASCQFARVKIDQTRNPPDCRTQKAFSLENCQEIVLDRKTRSENLPEGRVSKNVIKQHFFIGGLYPFEMSYTQKELCPSGKIYDVYQYFSLMDGLYENLSVGLYSPRTLQITCILGDP